jgi:hypothetical protein
MQCQKLPKPTTLILAYMNDVAYVHNCNVECYQYKQLWRVLINYKLSLGRNAVQLMYENKVSRTRFQMIQLFRV